MRASWHAEGSLKQANCVNYVNFWFSLYMHVTMKFMCFLKLEKIFFGIIKTNILYFVCIQIG